MAFVVALLWRHRIRYAVERFLYTGKVDEGVQKTIEMNVSSVTSDRPIALPVSWLP